MFDFEYRVFDYVLEAMKNKTKKIEIRLLNEKSSKIKVGDIIKFKVESNEEKYILVKVIDLIIYEDVNDLINRYDFSIATNKSNKSGKETIKNDLYNIFGKEKVDNSKMIGIKFDLIDTL